MSWAPPTSPRRRDDQHHAPRPLSSREVRSVRTRDLDVQVARPGFYVACGDLVPTRTSANDDPRDYNFLTTKHTGASMPGPWHSQPGLPGRPRCRSNSLPPRPTSVGGYLCDRQRDWRLRFDARATRSACVRARVHPEHRSNAFKITSVWLGWRNQVTVFNKNGGDNSSVAGL